MTYTLRRIDCSILNSTFFGSKLTFDLLFVKIAVLFRKIYNITDFGVPTYNIIFQIAKDVTC
jgi:hypothetical protein